MKQTKSVRRKGLVITKNILLGILVTLLLITTISPFLHWKPPMSVTLVPFKMALQITLKIQVALTALIVGGFIIYRIVHKTSLLKVNYNFLLILICFAMFVTNLVTWIRISSAKAEQYGISYETVKPGANKGKYTLALAKDYGTELSMGQCKLYQDAQSEYKGMCVIYLNYGGWNMQEESYGQQVFHLCEKEGYSFVRLADQRKQGEQILEVVQKINAAVNDLLEREQFERVVLCGGSAGGHLSLLCANKQAGEEHFPIEAIHVDGVVALYPCVNPKASYDYYVDRAGKHQGLLGWLGDKIYCGLYQGESGSFAKETQKLDEGIFGRLDDPDSYYDETNIENCISPKDFPTLIVQGGADSMIYVDSVRDFIKTMKVKEKPISYLELPCTEHVFDLMPTAACDRCEKEMTGFLRNLMEHGK